MTLTALRCGVCAEQAPLSTPEPVASAEIATFISAHAKHDRLAIEILIPTTATTRHVNKQFSRD